MSTLDFKHNFDAVSKIYPYLGISKQIFKFHLRMNKGFCFPKPHGHILESVSDHP